MNKIKRFVDCGVPVLTCNLRCPYCYITQERKFLTQLPKFKYSPEIIGKSFAQERWGGPIHINFCGGGETLLPPDMTAIIHEILKQGHYIAIVTNGTITKRFEELCALPKEEVERLLFKFSFHYLELKRLNMLKTFFNNIKMVRKAGASFSLELTPADYYIGHLEEIKKVCLQEVGALCHITVAREETNKELPILTKLSPDEYKKTWGQFKSPLFDFKMSTFYKKRKEFCYGGEWTSYLNLGTGILKQCYCGRTIQNIFENPETPINWQPIGANCPEPHCHNSHVWLTLGAIPDLITPTYTAMRDRITSDGQHWLNEKMRSFLSGKLIDSNKPYNAEEQKRINSKEGLKVSILNLTRNLGKKVFYSLPKKLQNKILTTIRPQKH